MVAVDDNETVEVAPSPKSQKCVHESVKYVDPSFISELVSVISTTRSLTIAINFAMGA